MANILAIDTSSAWCSVALSLEGQAVQFRHEAVTVGASQLLLPWIESLLSDAKSSLTDLDAIAVGIGPGAFTGVRLGVAAVQGLAVSQNIPVVPVCSLDAIAAQLLESAVFKSSHPQRLMIAIDARMEEVYWASYDIQEKRLPSRIGDIHLTKPEDLNLEGVQLLAGSALNAYNQSLPQFIGPIDPDVSISALGILKCAQQSLQDGAHCEVRQLEPLYVRDKVAFTTAEREEGKK
ncbi:tRNA (adenosine(37)-N6)-threonylcarbamoyltransferase complex dimerization subunit type 1 TsaB [Polynucleobacter sp. 86C-FISCH]|uniref:tRNA (adenosine(37)-N6)-threonylcarbamoyltransferase complex dimerization subunit type 1 TsaB n=1 Tax=Polynucleobacter sp. 86C-FISCH TaxID=2689101 RepID=UPI001EC49050|nr:tRNA (adenosine(37)-N6)-threonylcarbamoyltransferase complex dimerization subunit type 1 TsaB [Polynucleobacter sp. 86C-FISCH]MBU3596563.1 tRNA (adenosine(37)-N6)-threonylcarbamoyltransferase complex dimerization subunit type 1 TsaB [Polynucleobacter sp. 86C-FISCH]